MVKTVSVSQYYILKNLVLTTMQKTFTYKVVLFNQMYQTFGMCPHLIIIKYGHYTVIVRNTLI